MSMVPVRCNVHSDVRDQLKRYAEEHGISMSIVIRKLCYYFMDISETKRNQMMGKY